jgi:hypothetical protein
MADRMTCNHSRLSKFGKSQAGFQRFQCIECGYVATKQEATTGKTKAVARIEAIASNLILLKDEYNSIVSKTVLIAKEMGLLLNEAKSLIPANQWTHWLSANVKMTRDVARRYMLIAAAWESIEAHEAFPRLTMKQMCEIAMGRPAGTRNNHGAPVHVDRYLDVIEQMLHEHVESIPELKKLIDAIEESRPYLVSAGLLRDVESEIESLRKRRVDAA